MCGIAGWVIEQGISPSERTQGAVLQALAHRGPDGEGMYRFRCADGEGRVFLGHRRLAIIDPNGARQPMCDDDAGLALTYNGEIYNFRALREELRQAGYRFSRDSDTEVLLRGYQHWGPQVVHHLRGMFAFAVWDEREERLFMARDRFGEKPLFVHQDAHGLYFSSEIKALLRIPQINSTVNLDAVTDYLAYRYVPGPKTLFSGIRKLMPGSYAIWQRGKLTETRYWVPPDRKPAERPQTDESTVATFLSRLDEAVKLQMVSDVPFGAFLSGGLDSSTIVALMRRHSSSVNTFSVGFGEGAYSELAYAGTVAQQLGTTHHELTVSHRDMIDRLPSLVSYRDAPVSEPSDIPIYMLACEAAQSVKMVLTGEGSDEILGGYPKHIAERFAGSYQLIPGCLRNHLIAPLAHALPYSFRRVKTAVANLNIADWRERYVRWFGALNHAERDQLSVLRQNPGAGLQAPPFDADAGTSTLRRMLYFDQTSWLPDNLLERGDRMTMAASIESRVPFLDHELAAFVSSLPDNFRVRGMCSKWILREAAKKLIPEQILRRPKVGFRVPVNEWFRTEMREFLMDHLHSGNAMTRAYYDTRVLDRALADHVSGKQNHEKLLWTLLNLEIWHRQYA